MVGYNWTIRPKQPYLNKKPYLLTAYAYQVPMDHLQLHCLNPWYCLVVGISPSWRRCRPRSWWRRKKQGGGGDIGHGSWWFCVGLCVLKVQRIFFWQVEIFMLFVIFCCLQNLEWTNFWSSRNQLYWNFLGLRVGGGRGCWFGMLGRSGWRLVDSCVIWNMNLNPLVNQRGNGQSRCSIGLVSSHGPCPIATVILNLYFLYRDAVCIYIRRTYANSQYWSSKYSIYIPLGISCIKSGSLGSKKPIVLYRGYPPCGCTEVERMILYSL